MKTTQEGGMSKGMMVTCKTFGVKVWHEDYPCYMCYCGANDGVFSNEKDCDACTWPGCTHPECPKTGCRERSEDICQHKNNLGVECPKNCPLNRRAG